MGVQTFVVDTTRLSANSDSTRSPLLKMTKNSYMSFLEKKIREFKDEQPTQKMVPKRDRSWTLYNP